MSRRCLVSDLVLFPGLIAVDNASKAVSCSALGLSRAGFVDSSLSRYFEPQVLARILAGPSRRAQDPLVLDISVAAPPQAAQMPDVTAASGQYEVPVPTERELEQLGIEQAGYPEILHVYNILLSITDDNLDTVAERILDIYCREIYQGLKTLDDNRPPGAKYMYPQAHSEVGGLGLFSDPNGHRRIFKVASILSKPARIVPSARTMEYVFPPTGSPLFSSLPTLVRLQPWSTLKCRTAYGIWCTRMVTTGYADTVEKFRNSISRICDRRIAWFPYQEKAKLRKTTSDQLWLTIYRTRTDGKGVICHPVPGVVLCWRRTPDPALGVLASSQYAMQ
ncbi:hypothetical protein VTP01DRAFT_7287 [Rhizomucor pusillus]|uniref:uncharacterized protein n=1 Tax=Rhizomucor pusillus TaxID=4840 RepID=UPI003743C749